MSVRGSLVALALSFLAAQALLLPAGWVTGDQGSKYLQARAFAMHGPFDPAIDVLSRDIDHDYRYQEPKLKLRGGRLVSEFLWLLPLTSAPFLRAFGVPGIYVVPALSVLAIFIAAAALGRRLGEGQGVRTAWAVVLVTPVVLYGLEFWEHAPATACVLVAAVLLFPDTAVAPPKSRRVKSWVRPAAAGAVIAAGVLFREEVAIALPALLVGQAMSVPEHRIKTLIASGVWAAVGAVVVFAAGVPLNLLMYGSPLPMHVTQDAWQVAINTPYLTVRRQVLEQWLLPSKRAEVFVPAAIVGIAAALFQAWRVRTRGDRNGDAISRALLMVTHLAAIATLAISVGLPLWRLMQGLGVHSYKVGSAVHTWPFALALLYLPWLVPQAVRPAVRFLVTSGLLLFVGTLLIVPTDGGAQWSPRFVLGVAPLLAIVPAAGAWRKAEGFTRSASWMVATILVASILMQVQGVVWLRTAKADTARLTAWVAELTRPGDVVISNVYWFPEVTATLAPTRRLLYSFRSTESINEMAAAAVAAGFRRFAIVSSVSLTFYEAPAFLDLPGAPCRFVRGVNVPIKFGLVFSEYTCAGL